MATHKEILQLLMQVSGQQDVAGLADAIDELRQSGEEGAAAADKLVAELDQLAQAKRAADSIGSLKAQIADTDRELAEAEAGLIALNAQFSATDRSSKSVTQAFKQAGDAVDRLQQRQREQTLELQRSQGALAKAGVSTDRLATESDRLGREIKETADRLRQQATASTTATASQARLNAEARKGEGIFGRLKGAFAGFIAALGVRELAQGAAALLGLGEAADKSERQFSRLFGGAEQGKAALEGLRTLADNLGQDFDTLRTNAAKLKTFGLDPLDGTLQSLIDQNTAAGGSNQDLEGKILAVGQAWSKQKLQGEEILQLVERGIPVWDLLSKATGKNVPELQKLSEAGKLGRAEIKLLLEEIGKANSGAAADALTGLTGRLNVLQNKLREVGEELARDGLTDAVADSLGRITTELQELANSPEFEQIKRSLTGVFTEGLEAAEQFLNSERFRQAAADIAGSLDTIRLVVSGLNAELVGTKSLVDVVLDLGEVASTPVRLLGQLATDLTNRFAPAAAEAETRARELVNTFDALGEAANQNSAFAGFRAAIEAVAQVAQERAGIVRDAFKSIGVEAQHTGVEVTENGQKIVDALRFLAAEATISGDQFKVAFTKALDSATTEAEARRIADALKLAFETGKISALDMVNGSQAVVAKLAEIKAEADKAKGAFAGIGQAAQESARQSIAAWEATRSSLAAQADQIAKQLADAFKSGADPTVINPLLDKSKELDTQINTTTENINKTKDSLQQTGATGSESLGQVTDSAKQAADAAGDVGDQAKEGAGQAKPALLDFANYLKSINAEFAAVSENARLAFVETQKLALSGRGAGTTLLDVFRLTGEAADNTRRAIDAQSASLKSVVADYLAVGDAGEAAGIAFRQAARDGSAGLRQIAEEARNGVSAFNLLNQADLDQLAAAADQAAAKIQQIEDAARAATAQLEQVNDSLQDQLDRRAGNDADILRREYERQIEQIKNLGKTADAEGKRLADEALLRAQRNFEEEMRLLEEKTRREAEAERGAADARIQNAQREADARRQFDGSANTDGGRAGELVVKFRNEVSSGSVLGRLDDADIERLTGMIVSKLSQLRGVS